ncbi:BTAD domain-containing putative transcriptional regulator [Paractinoplanes ferrugineus]|uniref:SARP family transcriptional regulator n=1 Tax=Paractinoplanes ferrugineus TaxID=113564 RepID=A0A919IYE1_9ACTN|nr:BTAD domain-containing putative transcriptional regulator [Actinoplanes ferrugineus]GIE10493.1 SARP family transcriptional regulator [Actinoplanes ferrugineus]
MQIGILGPFEVRIGDGVLADVPGARLRALLVALALQAGHPVGKATLIDWIWGQNPPADATNSLHRLVSRLRKALPDGAIEGQTDGYRLAVGPDAVDAVRFERLARDPRRAGEALTLWRGPALQDVGPLDSEAFDAAVTRLENLRLSALEDRFAAETGAVAELTALVAAHPVRERLVAALIRALAAAGNDSEALLVYQRTREVLADTLGVDPSPELSAVHVALLRGELSRRATPRATNLRAELTSYLGKESDVAAVRALLTGHRLTTLIGPGGSGKTRLANETARTLLDAVPDGVWLVELAAVTAGGDVAQTTLAALGQRDSLLGVAPDAEPVDRVIAAIRDRAALLILDNCEHLIESAAAFAHRVLGECRRLRILATSREPLGITGEALWTVEPLALPGEDDDPAGSPAVQLLRDRAGAVRPDLGTDVRTMARVCRALDGMPLAIELAAARLRTMTLDQLANRLDDRFRLLTGGSRTALPRHRTLRAVIDWSWGLLDDAERTVLRRLSVFAGGAGLDAAERVCGGPDVLELLTALTEKSLVVTAGDGTPRYRMLGTIKEYAAQRLDEAGEAESVRRAHLAYFTELTETAEPGLRRAEQLRWLVVLRAEHDNIAAAMRGAFAAGDADGAIRLAASAGWYWWLAGHKAEGNELVVTAAALPGGTPGVHRALVYTLIAQFLFAGQSDQYSATEWIHQAYEMARDHLDAHPALRLLAALDRLLREPAEPVTVWEPLLSDEDPWVRGLGRLQLGKMRIMLGDGRPEADALLVAALDEVRRVGERWTIAFALVELAGRIAMRGEFGPACEYYEEAIATVAELGALEDIVGMRARQAQLYRLLGDERSSAAAMAEAQRCAERVAWPNALAELALARAELAITGDDRAQAHEHLAVATAMMGAEAEQPMVRALIETLRGWAADDLDEAREHRVAAYRSAAEAAHPLLVATVLVGIADQALREQQYERAAELIAAGIALRGLPDRSQPAEARIAETARRHLGTRITEVAPGRWRELAELTLAC